MRGLAGADIAHDGQIRLRGLGAAVSRGAERHFRHLLILPTLLLLCGLIAYPLGYLINISLKDITLLNILGSNHQFVGLANFAAVLTDPDFLSTVRITVEFTLASLVVQLGFGLMLGLVFSATFRGKQLLLALMMVPILMTPVVVGLFWKLLLNGEWGIINYLLSLVRLPSQLWLVDPRLALPSVVMVYSWAGISFVTLVVVGGIAAQPVDLYEAARVDGASYFQMVRNITLPLLRPILLVITLILTIDALKAFDIIYVLTAGGPGGLTRVYGFEIFDRAFNRAAYSVAAAEALVLVLLTTLIVSGLVKALRTSAREAAR